VKNLGAILLAARAHIAHHAGLCRARDAERAIRTLRSISALDRWRAMIGTTEVADGVASALSAVCSVPVNLEARHVVGVGLSIRP
jgi:hypothetical protein